MKKKSFAALMLVLLMVLSGCGSTDINTQINDGFVITFNPNDRDQTVTQVSVRAGEKLTAPEMPVRQDYVFTGWYTNKRISGEPFDFDAMITNDLFLYAGWTTDKVKVMFDFAFEGMDVVTLNIDGGSAIDESDIPQVPVRDNYRFVNWFKDAGYTEAFDFSHRLTKNTTVYAKWAQLAATVTYDLGYFGAKDTPKPQTLDLTKGEKAMKPIDPVRGEEGDYLFEGWFTGTGKKEALYDFDSEVTQDLNLHAKWQLLRATVTYDMNCQDVPSETEKVAVGSKASANESIQRTGYDFIGWYFDKECTAKADLSSAPITEDMTVYASWKAQPVTVTFKQNFTGAPANETVASAYGEAVSEPKEPQKDGDEFIGWFTDEGQTQAYIFGEKLTGDLTLYAGWASKTASSETKPSSKNQLTFYMNDGTENVYQTEEVQRNKYSAMRTNGVTYPQREGYKAFGWYTTKDCQEGTEFNFSTRITNSQDLYVKWLKEHIFEAELTQLTAIPIGDTGKTEDKLGFGESSNPKGLYLIEWDCYEAGASNEYYISYLYNPGSFLEFCITAQEDVKDATLVLRLTPELHDMFFLTGGPDGTAAEKNGYKIYVNPVYSFNSIINKESLESFEQMYELNHDLTGAVTKDEDPNYTRKRAFEDYTITASLSLNKGENIIRLVTENTHDYGGSMHAAAPMVDCIKIYTSEDIAWTEGKMYQSNLDGIDVRWPAKQK